VGSWIQSLDQSQETKVAVAASATVLAYPSGG
jgi:hypothetical protein